MTTTSSSTSSTAAPAAAALEVKMTLVEDQQTAEQLKARAFNTQCAFETDFPPNLLQGAVYVVVSEADQAGQPARIVDNNEPWLIDIYLFLGGPVAQLICGQWSLKVFMESMGKDGLDVEFPPNGFRFPTNSSGYYHIRGYFPGYYVKAEPYNGTPYQINVVSALLTNNGVPSPIIGFCSLDPILFFNEGIEI